jgi:hypothetical protein
MELFAEAPPEGQASTYATQDAQGDEAWDLLPFDRNLFERLLMLWEGLERSDVADRRGEPAERYGNMAVTGAAGLKDRNQGRMIDPDMTLQQAVARLREPE